MEINQKVYQLSGKSNLCRESSFTFSFVMHSRKSGKCTEDAGVQCGIISTVLYRCCRKKWRYFYIGNSKLILDETIGQATSGDPEAVDEVLRHYSIFSSTICCGPPGNYQAGRFFDKLEQGLKSWGLSSL